MTDRKRSSLWYQRLDDEIRRLGGMFNAHLHLDRAGTLDELYMERIGFRILDNSHISLHRKHGLITDLHAGEAYSDEDFNRRVDAVLDHMVAVNTRRADTLVDVTADGVGLSALNRMKRIQQARKGEIDLRFGAYTPFGFVDAEPERWEVFEEGARQADFTAALPEADDTAEYPTHIGFMEHCRRTLSLAKSLGKPIHVHVDQRNEPSEDGTEQLIEVAREIRLPAGKYGEPVIWAVHLISPSTYDDARFEKMVEGMLECNIGLITCPSAAIGMRMYRPILTPTYNSIPRVLEMLAAGVHVRMGSDNIADICSPSTTPDLVDELFVLSAAVRFYNTEILATLAAGHSLSDVQRAYVREHLESNDKEIRKFFGR